MTYDKQPKRGNWQMVPYVLIVTTVLTGAGVLIWIIQLARSGDSVGITILAVLLTLLALPVLAVSLALLILVFGRWVGRSRNDNDWQAAWQSQKLMKQQIQDLQYLLLQVQKNPELALVMAQARSDPGQLLTGSLQATPSGIPAMQPGQLMTADGFVVDSAHFHALDATDQDLYEKNSVF